MRYFLVLEIESPRGARQLKGDTSVVLEGSDGLEEMDKFLGDKVCKLDVISHSLLSFYSQLCCDCNFDFISADSRIQQRNGC
jgi:hypothetical protein